MDSQPAPAKFRVLIVDDDRTRGDSIERALSEIAVCTKAVKPLPAIKLVRTQRFDLIMLDHDLGDKLTGVDVAFCMYFSTNRYTPVVIHSANPVGAKNIWNAVTSFGGKAEVISYTEEGFYQKVIDWYGGR